MTAVLYADLVDASTRVAGTSSRREKIAILAGVLERPAGDEIEAAVWFLAGGVRQGRLGVGYAGAFSVEVPPAAVPGLTVAEVDRAFGSIPGITGPGSQGARSAVLERLLEKATAAEQDHLRALLVGGVRQGALEGILIEGVAAAAGVGAPALRRAVMLSGDLGVASRIALTEGLAGLERIGLTPMTPVKPMLASSAATAEEAIRGEASVEWKLDGARIQVHRLGPEVRVFTRNLNDGTARMPGVVEVVRSLPVTSVVLDGEAISVESDGSPRAFQETMSRFGSEETGAGASLVPFFFDVLELDGESLIDLPLRRRKEILGRVVPERLRVPAVITGDLVEAQAALEAALDAGHEGVVIKDLEAPYEAGRRGATWRKVKPAHTYDLVVLGVEWGHGRRSGWLSNIHLGARDGDRFVMVGKTFKGMTDEMLAWQTRRFLDLEERRTRSTVYVRPEQVVEVAIDGVQASPRYPGGIALRFARVRRYREDKDAAEADTLEALRRLLSPSVPG